MIICELPSSADRASSDYNYSLDQPFELVKADINATFSNITFDASILPVPSQNTVTFCNKINLSIVDDLGAEIVKMAKIGVAILILTALLLTGLHCLWIKYRWGRLMAHLQYTRQAWMTDPTVYHTKSASPVPEVTLSDHNLLVLQADMHHPLITRIINNFTAKLRLTTAQHIKLRWFFHYIFHPPALACFLIGFLGLLSVEIQLLALGPLRVQFSDQVSAATTDFSSTIATAINASMFNQSAAYANDVNSRVDVIQTTINDGLLGWVNDTTTTLNNTINAFYTDVQNVVTTLFNGTFFEAPAQDFVKCILGSKIDAIEDAITFLHNNLQVNMPRVNESVLVLSPSSVDEVTQPIARAAVGSGNNGTNTGIVGKLINAYEESLKKERAMFGIFMGIWGIVVMMAICILLWNSYGSQWLEQRRRRKWQKEQRSGIDGLVVPLRDRPSDEKRPLDISNRQTTPLPPPFTPVPTPREAPWRRFASFNANGSLAGSSASSINHDFEPTHPRFRSDETLVMALNVDDGNIHSMAEKSNAESPPVKTLDMLRSIGRKMVNREHVGDDTRQTEVKDSENGDDAEKGRRVAWLRRVASKLGKNANGSEAPSQPAPREELASTREEEAVTSSPSSAGGLKSRWSNDTSHTTPIDATPLKFGAANRRMAPLPPVPLMPKHPLRPARPPVSPGLDVEGQMHDQGLRSSMSTKPTIAPVPLHHAFASATPKPPQPPVFDWSTRSGFPPPPSRNNGPKKSLPKILTSALSLGVSNSPGTAPSAYTPLPESAILPSIKPLQLSPKFPGYNQRSQERDAGRELDTSTVTRLLTARHAQRSSGMTNPFISPFDDEHRVTIRTDNPARASVATNPFASPAGIAL